MMARLARPTRGTLGAIVFALALGAATTWAAMTVLRPPEDPSLSAPFTYVAAAEGTVRADIMLNALAEWQPVPVGVNRAQGVVTTIAVAPGDEVAQGSLLYSVGMRPVVVAQGMVPAFRPIGEGDEGSDVAQLQQLLADLGFYGGEVDGEAGPATAAAIKSWQMTLEVKQTGRVAMGDLIFVPELPTRITLDADEVFRGATLTGGESVLRGLPASPVFTVPVTEAQAAMIPSGTRVEVTSPSGDIWDAVATDQVRDSELQTVGVGLTGAHGPVLCDDACGQVPVTGVSRLSSQIVTVEPVTGLVIPSAALITAADGQTAVVDEDGERVPVTVVTSARGMSIIEGVAAGARLRVPAGETGPSE